MRGEGGEICCGRTQLWNVCSGGLEKLSKKMPIFCGYFRINSLAAKRCFISIIDGCFEKINAWAIEQKFEDAFK